MLLINIIDNHNFLSPNLFYDSNIINRILTNFNYNISHIFREGNSCANWLSKFGSTLKKYFEFIDNSLPKDLKGIVFLDKIGLL